MTEPPATTPAAAATAERDVLATKLHVPQTGRGFVVRPRLAERLAQAHGEQLTLVCAPAGFGKTALLADWARRDPRPVAWLSLDDGDNDPARFWRHVAAALDTVRPGVAQQVAALLGGLQPTSFEAVVTTLVNELAGVADEVVLVLDDYHLIQTPQVHQSLQFLLAHLPACLRLVLASRADPPLPLARLRARGQLAELREGDLRFTSEEAAELLRTAVGPDLTEAAVATLADRTEGWVAGLQLAALSLQGRGNIAAFVEGFSGSHRYVLDYLAEEVLDRQPQPLRAFLLATSVLERLSGPLCDAVTDRSDSQQLLEQAERANLFLVPLDEVRGWWRYHQLFADLLRARLAREQPEQVPELHASAAAWCEQQGLVDDAIRHAVAAGDTPWATRLVEQHLDQTLRRGEEATLSRWLSVLPDDAVRSAPALCLAQALMQFHTGHLESVERLLEHAQRTFDPRRRPIELAVPTTGGMVAELPAAIALLRAELAAVRGDSQQTAGYARSALAQLHGEEHGPRFWARWLLAFADWMGGRLEDAERTFAAMLAEGRVAPDLYPVMSTGSTLARVQRARGKLSAALRTYQEGLRFATEGGQLSTYHAGEPHVGIAQVLYERNHLDEALGHVTEGIELCRHVLVLRERDRGLVTLAWIRQAMGEADAALEAMNEACRMYPTVGVASLFNPAPSERARLLLAQGRIAEAVRWTKERGLTTDDDISYSWERDYLVLARVLLTQSEVGRALGLLERLNALAEAQGRAGSVIEIRALRSLALQAAGDHPGALTLLAETLALARPEGYVRVFADEGPPMAALLRSLLGARQRSRAATGSGATTEHLHRVIHAFGPVETQVDKSGRAVPGLIGPLTERELEVLRLLAAGRRNRDIARELVVTPETVKKHLSHIFDKLGATNRTQAVSRARELGLLP